MNRKMPLTLLIALVGTANALAIQPEQDPIISDQSVDEISEHLRDAGDKPDGILPTRTPRVTPVRPHAEIDVPEQAGRLLPEGAFIVQLEGRVHATSPGAWVFEPTQLVDNAAIKPMVILPSQSLSRLIQLVGQNAENNLVSLTGEALLYRGRNYLLVSAITAHAQEADIATPEPSDDASTEPESDDQPEPVYSQSVQDLIKELEEARHADRTILQPTTSKPGTGRAPVPEGRTFMRRRARLTYLTAGEIALAFDNDPDQIIDVPLVVLPCHLLERMERIVESRGDSLTVRVSGQSYAYNGRSYVLPTSITIERPGELNSRQ
ncbi:MAG: hypothetical protein KDA31_04420 [Phycisphaerales bacterium]|nr:hypothetical protein [Phycisphaerales bacterium]MCB9835573.1 hypothetical protein [Phycisphaera sp.]